jgi:transposase, IS30 family
VARPGVLTFGHRQVLEINWRAGRSITEIAGVLGVSVSTVSREVGRYHSAQHGFKNPLLFTLPRGRARRRIGWGIGHSGPNAALTRRGGDRNRPNWPVRAVFAARW